MPRMLVDPLIKARWMDYDGADGLSVASRADVKNSVALLVKRILRVAFTPTAFGAVGVAGATETKAITGLKAGDAVYFCPAAAVPQGVAFTAWCAADGTATISCVSSQAGAAANIAGSIVAIGLS